MLETILLGLIANEVNSASARENDINRFEEICNGSPLTPVEEVAITALAGKLLGGGASSENPLTTLLGL
jgi:hypothetical protein